MGPDAMILVCWMLSFKPAFSLSSFTFIKRLFTPLLSVIRVMSCAYLRLLIFLLAILIPVCVLSCPAFCVMYSVHKLNNQGDNIQPWHTPFPIWNQSVVPCPVLTCFLTCIQISQEAGQVVWYSHLFKNFLQFVVIHTVKGFGIVSKAEVDDFLELSFFFRVTLLLKSILSSISMTCLFFLLADLSPAVFQFFCHYIFTISFVKNSNFYYFCSQFCQ